MITYFSINIYNISVSSYNYMHIFRETMEQMD